MICPKPRHLYHLLQPAQPGWKTSLWKVFAVRGDLWLGEIKWFGRFRCYSFFPRKETVFEAECLADLSALCAYLTAEHREKAAQRRKLRHTYEPSTLLAGSR